MLRRSLLVAAACVAGAAVLAAASHEFWDQKDPKEWSADEAESMLNQSPWAKAADISFFNNSAGGFDFGLGGKAGAGLDGRRVTSRSGTVSRKKGTGSADKGSDDSAAFRGVVRWESSRAVHFALKSPLSDDAAEYYIIEVAGDLPSFAAPPGDDNQAANQQRAIMLRESTRLERKGGDPIYLDRVSYAAAGTDFYFTRQDAITLSNKEVTFTTELGPLRIKAKFTLKDMQYRGKLDL